MSALVALATRTQPAFGGVAPHALPRALVHTGAEEGVVCISERQRRIHVTFEALAVVVAAPFSIWLAMQATLPMWARLLSGLIGVTTLAVDGGLLLAYAKKRKG